MKLRIAGLSPVARVLLAGLALSLTIGWMVWDRARLLKTGREIVLKTVPVDPRDIFRGQYARLSYDISRLPRTRVAGLGEAWRAQGRRIYVVLAPPQEGPWWRFVRAEMRRPVVKDGQVMLRGRVVDALSGPVVVNYGIERYYAPPEKARALQRLASGAARPLGVIVRVSTTGRAAIAGLMIDGRRVYEEPLW